MVLDMGTIIFTMVILFVCLRWWLPGNRQQSSDGAVARSKSPYFEISMVSSAKLQDLLLENKDKFATIEKLSDTELIIDCNYLQRFLLKKAFLNKDSEHYRADKYGGNYKEYTKIVQEFIDNLNNCSIRAVLVFGESDLHVSKKQELAKADVLNAETMNEYPIDEGSLVVPRLFKVIFREAIDFWHPVCQIHQVARNMNNYIMHTANWMNCPVLSEETDLLVYPLKKGIINLESFQMMTGTSTFMNDGWFNCELINQEKIISAFPGLRPECLPFVNILLGEKTNEMDTFERIVDHILLEQANNFSVQINAKSDEQKRLVILLEWLSGKSREEILAFIMRDLTDLSVPEENQEKISKFCNDVLNYYKDSRSTTIDHYLDFHYTPDELRWDPSPKEYLASMFERYELSPCVNFLSGRTDYDVSFLSDFSRPPPYKLEFKAIRVAMALLRPNSWDFDEENIYDLYSITRRDGTSKLVKTCLEPMRYLRGFGRMDHLSRINMIRMPKETKRQLMMATFVYDQDLLLEMNQILCKMFFYEDSAMEAAICMMLVKFIAFETEEAIDRTLVASLLLFQVHEPLKPTLDGWCDEEGELDYAMEVNWFNSEEAECLRKLKKVIRVHKKRINGIGYPNDPEAYRDIVHKGDSFQASYHAYSMLNHLLGDCCCNPRLQDWFDGRLLFRLMITMRRDGLDCFSECAPTFQTLVNDVVAKLEASISATHQLYQHDRCYSS